MADHRIIRWVERADGTGYRRASRAEVDSLNVRLEGVDGDEAENTVTYWYTRNNEES